LSSSFILESRRGFTASFSKRYQSRQP